MYLKFGKYCDLFGVTQVFLLLCVSEFSVVQEMIWIQYLIFTADMLGAFLKFIISCR